MPKSGIIAILLFLCRLPLAQAACPASDSMVTGTGPDWYRTVAPSEHYDSQRSQRFPYSCTLAEITGSPGPYKVQLSVAPGSYPNLYNIATRQPDELFVYGGYPGIDEGAYVAKLDPATLAEQWRSHITISSSKWSFIGAMGVHGNGYVYSIQSNRLVRIDPATGAMLSLKLPQLSSDEGGTGAAYNGFVVTPDGLIVAKSMERGTCDGDGTAGIACVIDNNLPSRIVVVDPTSMTVLAKAKHTEAALGRIMTERHDGADYIYIPGLTALVRYRYADGKLTLDSSWGPVPYGADGANASGVGLMGQYAVAQTNYFPSRTASYVIAANIHDGSEHYAEQLFTNTGLSWVPDKAAIDPENGVLYGEDVYSGEVIAVTVDPGVGLKRLWKVADTATGFPALLGPATARELAVPHLTSSGDTVRWRAVADGATLAKSAAVAATATIGVLAPGFGGRLYYPSFDTGQLVQLTVQPR